MRAPWTWMTVLWLACTPDGAMNELGAPNSSGEERRIKPPPRAPRRTGDRDPAALGDITAGVTTQPARMGWWQRLPAGPALWLPDGALAYGAPSGAVRVITQDRDRALGKLPAPVTGLQLDPVLGRLVATDGHRLLAWTLATGAKVADLELPFVELTGLGFSGSGAIRAVGELARDARCTQDDALCRAVRHGEQVEWEQGRGLLQPSRYAPLYLSGFDGLAIPGTTRIARATRAGGDVATDGRVILEDEHDARLSPDGRHALLRAQRGYIEVRPWGDGVRLPDADRWSGTQGIAWDPQGEVGVTEDAGGLRRWSARTGLALGPRFGDGCVGVGWDDAGTRFAARCDADLVVWERDGAEVARASSETLELRGPARWLVARGAWWFEGSQEGVLWTPGEAAVPIPYDVSGDTRVELVTVGLDGRRAVVQLDGAWRQAALEDDRLTVGEVLSMPDGVTPQEVLPAEDPDTWAVSFGAGLWWIDARGGVRAALPEGFKPEPSRRADGERTVAVAQELHRLHTGVCVDLSAADGMLGDTDTLIRSGAFVQSREIIDLATATLVTQVNARALVVGDVAKETALDAAGHWLAVEDPWQGVWVFDLTGSVSPRRLPGVWIVKLFEGGRLVVANTDGLRTIELTTGSVLASASVKHGGRPAPKHDRVLASEDGALVFRSLPDLVELGRVPTGSKWANVALSPDERFAWVSQQNGVELIDVRSQAVLWSAVNDAQVAWADDGTPAWTERGRPVAWVDGARRDLPASVKLDVPYEASGRLGRGRDRPAAPQWIGRRLVYVVAGQRLAWDPRTGEVGLEASFDDHPLEIARPTGMHVTTDDRMIHVWGGDGKLRALAVLFWDGDYALFTGDTAIGRDRSGRLIRSTVGAPDVPVFPSWSPPTRSAPVSLPGVCRDARGAP